MIAARPTAPLRTTAAAAKEGGGAFCTLPYRYPHQLPAPESWSRAQCSAITVTTSHHRALAANAATFPHTPWQLQKPGTPTA